MNAKLLLGILLMTWTMKPAVASQTTEAGVCETCTVNTANGPRLKNNLPFVAATIDDINERMSWGARCESFADENRLGQWATSIRQTFSQKDFANLVAGSQDIVRVCPTYSQMKPTDKANFWVLVLNAMAHYESTCDKSESAKGPNGTVAGLLQLHLGNERVYSRGCANGDSATAEGTFRCALSMLDDQIRRDKSLFSNKSYWDVLRPKAKSQRVPRIAKAISAYTPCYDESKLNVRQAGYSNKTIFEALQAMDAKANSLPGAYDM